VIRFRPAAAREFDADFRHYENDYPGRGIRFVAAVDAALARISAAPSRFPLLYEPDIRSAKVKRFPYRVVYVFVGEDIDVIAVAHAKRRPSYWRGRLP
jgi:toxin ParE1/3/4